MSCDGYIDISLDVKNTGAYDGYEVVQLYVRDLIGSRVRPIKELRGFKKVFVPAGGSQSIKMRLYADGLAFHDSAMQLKVETGDFKIYVAHDSSDERYTFDICVK